MVKNNIHLNDGISRRRLLQGVGGAGVIAVAGCLGSGDAPIDVRLEVNSDNDDRVQMVELIASSVEDTGYFNVEIEDYEWNDYTARVMDPEYAENGYLPCIGLSGTFNPESFCNALHHSENHGQCCNLNGIDDPELDDMMDDARYGTDVVEDTDLRRERYDEIWEYLAEEQYSSITHFDLDAGVMNTDVHGFSMYPFSESIFSYGLYAPHDEQVMWLDEDSHPDDTDLSDLQEGGTLRIGAAENPDSFDPPYSTDTTSTMVQEFVFEQLVRSDVDGNLYPWLAESYNLVEMHAIDRTDYEDYMITVDVDEDGAPETDEQIIIQHPEDDPADGEVRVLTPDEAANAVDEGVFGMQYRYTIREGIEFTNGEELTAEHVVATAERYENSDLSAQTYDSLLHAREVDEYTVDLYAQIPDAEAERELPGLYIHSLEQAGLDGDEEVLDPREGHEPIGTGPYVFDEMADEQYVEYVRNEDYWVTDHGVDSFEWFDGPSEFPDGPVIERLELEIVPDNSTRSGALQNDEIDITYGLNTGDRDGYVDSDDYVVDSIEAGGYEFIQYPMHVEPWDDPRLRQAVNHLVPRESIVENVLNGWARPAWTDLPELAEENGTTDADALEDDIRPYNEYDPDTAVELIEEVIEDYGLD